MLRVGLMKMNFGLVFGPLARAADQVDDLGLNSLDIDRDGLQRFSQGARQFRQRAQGKLTRIERSQLFASKRFRRR